ncbi:MAG TPA: ABC transporter permease subunit [Anaerolineae bacterium]|nr:ABC transporter permease subunit [Anaerolineae bacterium]
MGTIFRHTFRRSRGAILGWGLGLFALGLMIIPIFDILADQQEQLNQLLEMYPPELIAFFGDFSEIASPSGFLGIEYFSYMPLILGIYGIIAGSGLIVGDEENGTLDLIMGYPLSRTSFFIGRVLSVFLTLISIIIIAWLGIGIPSLTTESFSIHWGELFLPFLSLLAILLLFTSLALLMSMLLPSRRSAAMVTGILLVASFFINGFASINEDLQPIADFLPLKYYQGGDALNGLNWNWVAGLLGFALLFVLLSWWQYQRRDIRVAGEGSWSLLDTFRRNRRRTFPKSSSTMESSS